MHVSVQSARTWLDVREPLWCWLRTFLKGDGLLILLVVLCALPILDASSSASLQASILAISEACGPDSILPQVVDLLLAGPMKPAQCK